ncbi:MAG: hypothetical protein JWO78_1295 [Micavibrio sp.]|nr:hypothetical protein [Micavibrio sp.]
MSAVLAYSNTSEGETFGLQRKTLAHAFNRAAAGLKPQQPHADGQTLIAEAYIAQETLKQVGEALTSLLKYSEFEIGPEKDLVRAMDKVAQKGTDLSENCDFSRARHFTSVEQMKTMIDLFGQRGPVSLAHEDRELNVHILDVDNTFTTPNPKKPGLCNLDVKLLVPFTLEDGTETYHVCELQFILKDMRKGWDKSHDAFKESRSHAKRAEFLENAMEMLGTNSGTSFRRLEAEHSKTVEKLNAAEDRRREDNIRNAKKAGAYKLAGYQPCKNGASENLASAQPKDYIKLVPA